MFRFFADRARWILKKICSKDKECGMKTVNKDLNQIRADALAIFKQGIKAVDPGEAVGRYCRREGDIFFVGDDQYDLSRVNRIFVTGAGKASAPMAAVLEELIGDRMTEGLINVKYDHTLPLEQVAVVEAGHPVPDDNGITGAQRMLALAHEAKKDDLVFCLLSGGGSALLPLPAEGLSLTDKQQTIRVLMSCGATIHEINAVRKHTSGIKGGRLALAADPARVVSLILSDVVGDDLDVIASGPTVPDASTFADCLAIIQKYDIEHQLPGAVLEHIRNGRANRHAESPKPGNPVFENTRHIIIGSNFEAISAAQEKARTLGYHTLVLSSMLEGETRHVAHVHGAIAREIHKTGNPIAMPACILSGGETTVTMTGDGKGGRNQEFALAAAIDIAGSDRIVIMSGGTDGTDGPTDAAGAIADNHTVSRATALGMEPTRFLNDNDAYHFFHRLGDLLITGPTHTNVMDLRIVIATRDRK
jgi:hydroxypyruvate reductase